MQQTMLETGNNFSTKNMVSIQISLNGLSFYDTKRSKVWQSSSIAIDQQLQEQINKLRKLSNAAQVVVVTDNYAMVPADLYLSEDTELYFTAKLLPYDTNRFQYIEKKIDNIVFIIAIEFDFAALFSTTFTTLLYTHPVLQTLLNIGANNITIYKTNERCAISVTSHDKLIFSDYLKIASELDIVYYIKKLTSDNHLSTATINCLGTTKKQIAESLSPYFKNISYKNENS